jgi:hypothetical protein
MKTRNVRTRLHLEALEVRATPDASACSAALGELRDALAAETLNAEAVGGAVTDALEACSDEAGEEAIAGVIGDVLDAVRAGIDDDEAGAEDCLAALDDVEDALGAADPDEEAIGAAVGDAIEHCADLLDEADIDRVLGVLDRAIDDLEECAELEDSIADVTRNIERFEENHPGKDTPPGLTNALGRLQANLEECLANLGDDDGSDGDDDGDGDDDDDDDDDSNDGGGRPQVTGLANALAHVTNETAVARLEANLGSQRKGR